MRFLPVLLAALLAVPQFALSAPDDEPGSARVTTKNRPRWLPPADPEEEEELEEAPSRSKVAPAVVMGVSVIAAIAGGVYLAKTLDAIERADATLSLGLTPESGENVTVPTLNTEAIKDQQRAVLTNGIATTMLFSASIAGLVTSTVLLISD